MHEANRVFWRKVAHSYPGFFKGAARVLEVGSQFVNGSIRDHFEDVGEYIGVDWREGENVDLVCEAARMSFDERFDNVSSASMLEHDPEWQLSIVNMVSQMKESGILCLSWGAGLNKPHCHDTAIDNEFHPRPAGQVISLLEKLGLTIHYFRYEGRITQKERDKRDANPEHSPAGMGEVCLIAFKDASLAVGEPEIDELIPQDRLDWKEQSNLPQQGGTSARRQAKREAARKARRG